MMVVVMIMKKGKESNVEIRSWQAGLVTLTPTLRMHEVLEVRIECIIPAADEHRLSDISTEKSCSCSFVVDYRSPNLGSQP
jgi:hypothetical protein